MKKNEFIERGRDICKNLAQMYESRGDSETAETFKKKFMEIDSLFFGKKKEMEEKTISRRETLRSMVENGPCAPEIEKIYLNFLERFKTIFDENDPGLAYLYRDLVFFYEKIGDSEQKRQFQLKELAIYERMQN